jgi:hypothetical protein
MPYGGAVIASGQYPARLSCHWITPAGISTFFAIQ